LKKTFFAFLLSMFMAYLPCGFAWGDNDNYNGLKGSTVSVGKQTGGGVVGKCETKQEHQDCTKDSYGASKATCDYNDRKKTKLSCTAKECKTGFLLHIGYGFCRKEQSARDFCANKTKCSNEEIPVPRIIPNPNSGRKGNAFKDCFCADKNMVVYECGAGTGTPPIDKKIYTNLDEITVAKNTCTKAGSTFTGWKCGDNVLSPDDKFSIENKTTCVAQWDTNEYTVNYECGKGATGSVSSQKILYNTDVTLPGYDAGCLKEKSIFTGWVCDGQNVNETFTITKDTKCIAQWKNCDACNSGTGCTCDIKVEGNQCKYITGTETNYVMVSGENTNKPQCILAGEKDCKDSGGMWQDGKCKCNPDISETHWDINNKKCICDDVQKIIENNQCILPTKCPDGANGDYPNCDCGTGKDYDEKINQCVSKCNENIATWENGACKCKDTEKLYNNGQCECPSDKPADANGKCVAPTVCPNDSTGNYPNCKCNDEYKKYDTKKNKCIDDEIKKKQKAYDDAKAKEQSLANRALTAATVATTGLGGMELARGLAEQSADKDSDKDMAAYIETMRCEYADGKSVKAGPDEIELPGGNNQNLMNLRGEYFALASDLKMRKEALGMKPGIESEEILDKAILGLYDDENVGITGGSEASRYRAQMLGSKKDKSQLDELSASSSKRVKGGAIAAGTGVVGGIAGNAVINGNSKTDDKKSEHNKGDTNNQKNGDNTTNNIIKK